MPGFDVRDRGDLVASRKRLKVKERALEGALRGVRKLIVKRDRQLRALPATSQRRFAVNFMLKRVGRHEDAGRPNRAGWLDRWAKRIGLWMVGQPWCGLACWVACAEAGVLLDKRTVSTVAIRDLASRGQGGYRRWKPLSQVQPGDFLVYGTRQTGPVHVGMYVGNGKVAEGNTSPGNGGSQNDGGGLYLRSLAERRSWVLGVAEPNYKS